jgi:hypothetical protein
MRQRVFVRGETIAKEINEILTAMAKEQAEYDAWVNAEEERYREASRGAAPEKNETATDWLARMKKEGRI